MIYLDNNATTRLHPKVLEAMMPFLTDEYANPSSGYRFARAAKHAVTTAREQVAELLGAQPDEIIFTAGGTESDNTALASAAACTPARHHVITSTVEHPAVTHYCEYLERRHNSSRARHVGKL